MAVGELAIDHAAPAKVGDRGRARSPTPRPLETRLTTVCIWIASCATRGGNAGARREPGDDIVQAGGDVARHHDEGFAGERAHRELALRAAQAVARRQRGDEALALHHDVLEVSAPATGGSSRPKSSSPAASAAACSGESISRSASVTPGRAALNAFSRPGSTP